MRAAWVHAVSAVAAAICLSGCTSARHRPNATDSAAARAAPMVRSQTAERPGDAPSAGQQARRAPESTKPEAARVGVVPIEGRQVQDKVPSQQDLALLEGADTAEKLDALLNERPGLADQIVPRLEKAIVADITKGGLGDRFVIKELGPRSGSSRSVTIAAGEGSMLFLLHDFPGDNLLDGGNIASGGGAIPHPTNLFEAVACSPKSDPGVMRVHCPAAA